MLQQTQASRVIPKWHEFLAVFPTATSCAAAGLGDVLRLWQGLGYPRRARHLHMAATSIAAAGRFPDTLDELLGLPGVGQYTARAVLVFAFERDVAVVDTNIGRVLARLAGRRLLPSEVQRRADDMVPPGDSWTWNQWLMDIGAVLCRPYQPDCDHCPLAGDCAWHAAGGEDPAVGSARVSKSQSRFDGSDRQARGRLLASLTDAPLPPDRSASVMRCEASRADRLVDDLVREGLVVRRGSRLQLP